MAQDLSVNVFANQLWPQGDARDPLGIWGARLPVTGDASGGEIKVTVQAPSDRRAAYVYTCYSANIAVLLAAGSSEMETQIRLLTNWPDIGPTAGVTAYSTARRLTLPISGSISAPEGAGRVALVDDIERFILLFDPRATGGVLPILELKAAVQVLNDTYSFEAYGYFWDRAVMQTPGGPRHPGSS